MDFVAYNNNELVPTSQFELICWSRLMVTSKYIFVQKEDATLYAINSREGGLASGHPLTAAARIAEFELC